MSKEIVQGLNRNREIDLILVNSPLRDYDRGKRADYPVLPPLGLGYIASESANKGYNVGLLDAEYHGLGLPELAETINNLQPRFVGINILTPTRNLALQFASRLDQDIPLVVGGPHASALPQRTLKELVGIHKKTILITDEAELAIAALLDGQSPHAIPRIYWLDDETVRSTPGLLIPQNLDELALLDRKFLANEPLLNRLYNTKEAHMISGRGCLFNCSFCAGAREVSSSLIKLRSPGNLIREINGLVIRTDGINIRFLDDLFILSEKRIRAIFQKIEESGIPNFFWSANSRVNILARFSEGFFDYLKEHGAQEIAIGIESGSDRLRRKIDKNVTEEEIRTAVQRLTERQIHAKGYFMIGLPTETKEETLSTLALAQELTQTHKGFFIASIFIFRPYPGTRIWKDLLLQGHKEEDLLTMYPAGVGRMARHNVIPKLQFAELTVGNLLNLLAKYNQWQDNFLGINFFS